MIVLGAAFLRSGFFSPGAEWNKVFGDDFEHRTKQGLLFARHASHGFEARTPVSESIDGAFETDPGQIDLMPDGGFLHQRAHEIIGNGVHHDFFFHHHGSLAAQHIHAEGDLISRKWSSTLQR